MQDEHFLVGIAPGNDRCDCGFWGPISFNMLDDIIVDVTYVLCFFPPSLLPLCSPVYISSYQRWQKAKLAFSLTIKKAFYMFLAQIFEGQKILVLKFTPAIRYH